MAPEQKAPARPASWRIILAILIVAALIVGLALWRSHGQKPPLRGMNGMAVPVLAQPAARENVPEYINALGTVTPLESVTVQSQVSGVLQALYFKEGQTVHRGQLLAQIDPRPFEIQLAQARAQEAKDAALLANAETDLQRYQTLYAQNSISEQQLATQQSLVRQTQAALAGDRAQIANARLQIGYSRITAPISGRAGLRQVNPGNLVQSGTANANGLVSIARMQPISVIFSIPENRLAEVWQDYRSGKTLPVTAYNRDMQRPLAQGVLSAIDNAIDPSTGTVKLRARFANADEALFPDQFVNVRLRIKTLKNVVVVPASAVQQGARGPFVFVVTKPADTVTTRNVTLGPALDDRVAVLQGLAVGELVVSDGGEKLKDGQKVRLLAPQGSGKAPRGASGTHPGSR